MGWLATIGLHALLGFGSYWVARFGLRVGPGWPRLLATAVLAWSWLTLGMEALGSAGILGLPPLTVWCLLALAIGAVCRRSGRTEAVETREDRVAWSKPAIVAVGFAVWGCLILGMPSLLRAVKVVCDGPIYHLYFAAKWWRAGRLFFIPTPFGESAAPYFPAGGDLWFTWLMVLWDGERLAKVGQAPFLMLAAAASYAIARLLGAGRSSAAIATAFVVTVSPLILFSFEANVDTIFIAGYLTSAYFFLQAARGQGGWPAFLLAGLAAGCSLGTKPTGVVFVPPLVLAGLAIARRETTWSRAALVVGGVVLPSAFWFARDFALTGNPLYPLHVEWGGRVIFPGWYTSAVMRLNPKYAAPFRDWRAALDILLSVTDPRLAPLWLAGLIGAWRWGRPATARDRLVWWCAGLAVLNFGLYWVFVPYRTQQRFFLQSYGMAAAPLALVLDRWRRLGWASALLLVAHVLTPSTWPIAVTEAGLPFDLCPFVPTVVPGLVPLPATLSAWLDALDQPGRLVSLGLLLPQGLLALAAVGCWARRRTRKGALLAGLVTIFCLGHSAAISYPWGLETRRRAFPSFDFQPGWLAVDSLAGPGGTKIAYAGTNLPFYLMGTGLHNDVFYVNVNDHVDWLLHDYHRPAIRDGRAPTDTTRPGWDREERDERAWLMGLDARGARLLVVTRADPREGPFDVHDRGLFPIERTWADGNPAVFELVYGAKDPIFRVYRIIPPQGQMAKYVTAEQVSRH